MKKERKTNKQKKPGSFWLSKELHCNIMGFRCPCDMCYLSEWKEKNIFIFFLVISFGRKTWNAYHSAMVCKIYKQVIKYSFVQAGMVAIHLVCV